MKQKSILIVFVFFVLFAKAQAQVNSFTNREYANVGGVSLRLDVFAPVSQTPLPTIIYVHGGGWNSGDRSLQSIQTRQIGRGYAVATISYRFSQQAKFPAQIHDVKAAIRYLRANAAQFNLDTNNFALWGRSAGGHLAAVAAASSAIGEMEDLTMGNPSQSSRVKAVLDWFGPVDLLRFSEHALSSCAASCPECANAPAGQLIGGDLRGLKIKTMRANPQHYIRNGESYPAFLVVHGTADCTVPPRQSQVLRDALFNVGADVTLTFVTGGAHGGAPFETAARQAEMDAFFDRVLK